MANHHDDEQELENLKRWFKENWIALAAGLVIGFGAIVFLAKNPEFLNADGSLDTSFDATAAGWTTGDVSQLVVQPDGKILVAGVGSGPASQCLTRLLPDGSLDPTFATDTGFRNPGSVVNEMRAMVLQADGKIVLGGLFIHRSASGTTATPSGRR